MLVLVSYDVSVSQPDGKRRLRNIAKTCMDYGMRVQNSVFECEVDPAQFIEFKHKLLKHFDSNEDSLRFYFLGNKGRLKVEHVGAKPVVDPIRDPLIL